MTFQAGIDMMDEQKEVEAELTFWLIDAEKTESFPPFVFYEYDPVAGEVLDNFVVRTEAPGWVIGVIHNDGQNEADAWYELYKDILPGLLKENYINLDD